LPPTVRERLAADGLTGTCASLPATARRGSLFIHRTHPVVAALADTLLEAALEETADASDTAAVARAGAAFVGNVSLKTTVLLLRLRHQLTVTRGTTTRLMLCEETLAVSVTASGDPQVLAPEAAQSLLGTEAVRNMPPPIRNRHLQQALDQLPGWAPQLEAIAKNARRPCSRTIGGFARPPRPKAVPGQRQPAGRRHGRIRARSRGGGLSHGPAQHQPAAPTRRSASRADSFLPTNCRA
jgi:hypothetical protein